MNSTSGIKNHLANEKSPYLLQHLYNPVDWYPWSEDALNRARNENKPIFISIGYSTCHWCHVMAHESFEDAQVAGKLNRDFIAIKVDREERPDIDTAFMQACQMMNKHGGWPLNLFLTPEGKPFYAMTYAPKHTQGRAPGFIAIIDKIAEIWKEQPDQLISGGEQVATAIAQMEKEQKEESLQSALLGNAAQNFKQLYDASHAGFGSAPKFPQPHNSALLFRLHQRFNDAELSSMALTTLDHIKQGGITDQLGGGLHRYSVDERWLVPHFEKMLYDQALITESYLDAWQVSGDSRFQLAAEKVLNYVLRELQNREGGFFCGEDADSEGAEGTYYLWTPEELQKHLSNEEYQLYASVYCITPEGNFEGGSILHRSSSMADLAQSQNSSERDLNRSLEAIHAKLLGIRNQRPHPHLDDKILAGWNGLMVAAMARAGALFQRDDYLQAAHMAVEFICRELYREGTLLRRYRHGVGEIDAFHEDYAYLIHGLIELFHADPKADILELALTLNETCNQLFRDEQGHYYDSAVEFIDGIGRGRSKQDGAIPAPASVTARNLIRLSRLTGRPAIEEAAQTILSGHLTHADRYPTAFAYLLMALDLYLTQPCSLVVVADEKTLPESWHSILCQFRPSLQILVVDSNNELADLVPQAAGKGQVDATITAWFCSGDSCLPPVNQPAELEKLLNDYIPLKTFIK